MFVHVFSIYLKHFPKVSTSVNTHWMIGLWDTFLTCELSHSWSFPIIVATQNLEEFSNGMWYLVFNTCTLKSRDFFPSWTEQSDWNKVWNWARICRGESIGRTGIKWFNQKYGTMLHSYIYWYIYTQSLCMLMRVHLRACMHVCVCLQSWWWIQGPHAF